MPGVCSPIQLSGSSTVLDDAYNANVGSMTAAVQVAEMPGYRVLVVGDNGAGRRKRSVPPRGWRGRKAAVLLIAC